VRKVKNEKKIDNGFLPTFETYFNTLHIDYLNKKAQRVQRYKGKLLLLFNFSGLAT
jgi:hypothetical protein